MKIEKIEKVKFEGDVYNLELNSQREEDDLFWVEGKTGIVTHNCFPKDMAAMLHIAMNISVAIPTITGAEITNQIVRRNKDWEKMEGRAVTKKENKEMDADEYMSNNL